LLTCFNNRGFPVEGLDVAAEKPRNRLARRIAAATGADAFSVDELCERHGICRSLLYALWREGKGPARMKVGGRTLISVEAAARWRQQVEAETAAAPKAAK
jgi:transposase-like protein